MHKGAIHTRHALKHILQTLAQIMTVAQGSSFIEHDIHFDNELVARVVGLQALNLADGAREAHGEIQQDVAVGGRGGGAREVADVRGRGAGPVDDYVEREEEAAQGVEPPDLEGGAGEWEDDAEGVEDCVG